MENVGSIVTANLITGFLVAIIVMLGAFLLRVVVKMHGTVVDLWKWHEGTAAMIDEINERQKEMAHKFELFLVEWRLKRNDN